MEGCFGVYKGICSNNNDPEGLGRIKAVVPQVFGSGTTESDWAWPCVPPGWGQLSSSAIPLPNCGVWIEFEGGDTDYPLWVGMWAIAQPGTEAMGPATTVTGPDSYGAAAAVGASLLYARADHDHGLPAALSPASTVTGPPAFGAGAVVGTSVLYARQDHIHGLPAAPASLTPAASVTGPDSFGAGSVVGTSLNYARQDHDHGLPASPTVPSPATAVTGPPAYSASPVVGTSTLYARQDHIHGLPALPTVPTAATAVTGPDSFGAGSVIGTSTNYARQDHDHGLPALGATQYLIAHGAKSVSANTNYVPALAGSAYTVDESSGTWTTGANGFEVPNAGTYLAIASNQGGATAYMQVYVTKNGAIVQPAQLSYTSIANQVTTTVILICAAGDYIGQTIQDGATESANVYLQIIEIVVGPAGPTGPAGTGAPPQTAPQFVGGLSPSMTANTTYYPPGSTYTVSTNVGSFVAGTNGWEVPNAGTYLVIAGAVPTGTSTWAQTFVTHNGVTTNPWSSSYTADSQAVVTTALVVCAAGDFLGQAANVGVSETVELFLQIVEVDKSGPIGSTGATGAAGISGGFLTPTAESANFNATNGNLYQITGAHTAELPTHSAGQVIGFISVNGSGSAAAVVSCSTHGGNILGNGVAASATSILLGSPGATVTLEDDGTNWNIIAGLQDSGWIVATPSGAGFSNSWTGSVTYRLVGSQLSFEAGLTGGTNNDTAFTFPTGYVSTINSYLPIVQGGGSLSYCAFGVGQIAPNMTIATSSSCFVVATVSL